MFNHQHVFVSVLQSSVPKRRQHFFFCVCFDTRSYNFMCLSRIVTLLRVSNDLRYYYSVFLHRYFALSSVVIMAFNDNGTFLDSVLFLVVV